MEVYVKSPLLAQNEFGTAVGTTLIIVRRRDDIQDIYNGTSTYSLAWMPENLNCRPFSV
jgi:hypothetical protein